MHAALLHDCGHFAFSHASELAFKTYYANFRIGDSTLLDFIQVFRDQEIASEISECISISICLSPRFKQFYSNLVGKAVAATSIYEICCFISGIPHDISFPGIANLISGAAVDADKIDYINRDATQCGIPVGIDVSRIFLNTALVYLETEQVERIARATRIDLRGQRLHPGVHFVVNSTGMDTYDELTSSKAVLYQRVYFHQLTRNAEQILAECLRRYSLGARGTDIMELFPCRDQQLLDLLELTPATSQLAKRLSARQLPKRALVLFRDAYEPLFTFSDIFHTREWAEYAPNITLIDLDTQLSRETAWRIWGQFIPADPQEGPERIAQLRMSVREFCGHCPARFRS